MIQTWLNGRIEYLQTKIIELQAVKGIDTRIDQIMYLARIAEIRLVQAAIQELGE